MENYISSHGQECNLQLPPDITLSIGIVVPVRDSQEVILTMITSLMQAVQYYAGSVKIILVGSHNDKTWVPIQSYIREGSIITIEIGSDLRYRDADQKRYEGLCKAIELGVDVIYFTDTKIQYPYTILSQGITLMQRHRVQAVAGTMQAWPEQRTAYWAGVLDQGLVTEMPRFGQGRLLNRTNYGKSTHLPVTSNFFIQRGAAATLLEQWPTNLLPSHEDSRLAIRLLLKGHTIWCTDQIYVYHKHRIDTAALLLKWWRAGNSIAGILEEDSGNPFARERARKAIVLFVSSIASVTASLSITGLFGMLGASIQAITIIIMLFLLGFINVVRAKHIRALLYPIGTILLVMTFVFAFVQTCIGKVSQEELLQIY